jgi:pyrroline-5-carboxylate reductase
MLKIGFIGAGIMAEALIKSILLTKEMNVYIIASDILKERREKVSKLDKVESTTDNYKVVNASDVIFIAVKPQKIDEILDEIKDTDKLIISIAAGVPISRLEKKLLKARVIRIMPNTPCLVSEMAGGFSLGKRATKKDGELLVDLLKNAGKIFQLDELYLDVVTALSGSGPAFIAYLVKSMVDGAIKQGLPPEIAKDLAIQTTFGTGKLLRDMDLSFEDLIFMVSSPGGTTIAGIQILESSDVKNVIEKTIAVATARGRELGRN